MNKPSDDQNGSRSLRDRIIGLGERSTRKSYYPQLQEQVELFREKSDALQRMLEDLEAARRSLAAGEERYRTIFENTGAATIIVDDDGGILLANEEFSRMSGYSREVLVGGMRWTDFLVPEDRARMETSCGRLEAASPSQARREDLWFVTASGNARNVFLLMSAIPGSSTSVISFLDITEQKRIQETLFFLAQRPWTVSGEDFFSSLARFLTKVLVVDSVFVGRLSADGVSLKTVVLCCHGEILPNVIYPLAGSPCEHIAVQTLRSFPEGVRERFPEDAFLRDLSAEGYVAVPLWDAQGRPLGLAAVVSQKPMENEALATSLLRLIAVRAAGELERIESEAEQRRLEEQLRQSQKMEAVGLLAGGVAHDFNNLLTPILGYAELLMTKLGKEDPSSAKLEQVYLAAVRAKDLTKRLLAFSRKQILELKVLNLGEVVRQFYDVLSRTIRENITIRVDISPFLSPVEADRGQLEQVLLNLCVNAQDALSGGGVIDIKVGDCRVEDAKMDTGAGVAPGDYVLLSVSDTGAGIDAETMAHIFEPFFTTKELGKGTGLGLSTVYGIIRQHGGAIEVSSMPGSGTTFRIYLPRAEGAGSLTDGEFNEMGKDKRGTETILVVEDSDLVRDIARDMLSSLGYRVLLASNPEACLERVASITEPIHLLLADVVMPKMNGKELYEQVQRLRPEIRALYMSGYATDVIGHSGILDASTPFLQKPFSLHALSDKVRQVLDES